MGLSDRERPFSDGEGLAADDALPPSRLRCRKGRPSEWSRLSRAPQGRRVPAAAGREARSCRCPRSGPLTCKNGPAAPPDHAGLPSVRASQTRCAAPQASGLRASVGAVESRPCGAHRGCRTFTDQRAQSHCDRVQRRRIVLARAGRRNTLKAPRCRLLVTLTPPAAS